MFIDANGARRIGQKAYKTNKKVLYSRLMPNMKSEDDDVWMSQRDAKLSVTVSCNKCQSKRHALVYRNNLNNSVS